MKNPEIHIGQAAAESGITEHSTKRAVYLHALAKEGHGVEYCSKALRVAEATVRKMARRFMIDLPDYRPFSRLETKGETRPEGSLTALRKL